jgi:hypothetical protein
VFILSSIQFSVFNDFNFILNYSFRSHNMC